MKAVLGMYVGLALIVASLQYVILNRPLISHALPYAAVGLIAAQEPAELPPGEFCEHEEANRVPAHPCKCHRMCVVINGEDEDGTQTQHTAISYDPQCTQKCFEKHCHCPVHNCE